MLGVPLSRKLGQTHLSSDGKSYLRQIVASRSIPSTIVSAAASSDLVPIISLSDGDEVCVVGVAWKGS